MIQLISSGLLGFALCSLGQFGLPLGLPPLPEDPLLVRLAPQDCVWYFSSSGVAEPDPKSKNQTEQLLAEPEVREFIAALGKMCSTAIREGAPRTPEGKVLGTEGPKLIHALLTRPSAVFVSKAVNGFRGLEISGGVVISTGDETGEIKASLEKIEGVLFHAAAVQTLDKIFQVSDAERIARQWHKFPYSYGLPKIEWGFRNNYLLIAVGEETAEEIWSRGRGEPPAWLATVRKRLPVERVSTLQYLNVKKFAPLIGADGGRSLWEAVGLADIQELATVGGLEGTGNISKVWLRIGDEANGQPNDFLRAFGAVPLTAAELERIPRDASFAVAGRIDPARLWTSVRIRLDKLLTATSAPWIDSIKDFEKRSALRIKEDLLDTLGDTFCMYSSPSEGGLLFTGLTIVVPVKDHDRLAKTSDLLAQYIPRVIAEARKAPQDAPQDAKHKLNASDFKFEEAYFKGQKIHCLTPENNGTLQTVAWCVTDSQLVISLSPQNIRAWLSRDRTAPSLAQVPVVAERLKAGKAALLTYQDTAGMLKITYPLLHVIAATNIPRMRLEGLKLEISALPSLPALLRHVEPASGTLTREKDGLIYVSRQSLPVDLMLGTLSPSWVNATISWAGQLVPISGGQLGGGTF